jgi:hypothetical protein
MSNAMAGGIVGALGAVLSKGPGLGPVAMPLVRLMRDGGLSWSQKEEIALVILALCVDHTNMKKEQEHLMVVAQQQKADQRVAEKFGNFPG